MKRLSLPKLLSVAGLVVALSVAPLGPTALANPGDIGGRPANPDPDNPRSGDIFIHTLDKGESANDAVLLINNTDEETVLSVYTADGVVSNTGSLSCRQAVEPVEAAGSWITLPERKVTLPANSRHEMDFRITVPEVADVGEHNACLVYQVETDEEDDDAPAGVSIQTRSATRVSITVPGDLKKELTIASFEQTSEKGSQVFTSKVDNVGNVSSDAVIALEITGLFGDKLYEESNQYPILPSNTFTARHINPETPFFGGFYTAKLSVAYDTRPGVFGVVSGDNITIISEEKRIFILPNPIVLAVGIVAVLAVLIFATRAILGRRKVKTDWQPYVAAEGDTVQSLAKAHATSWKKIAKVNAIKAPYTITAGDKLLLPKAKQKPAAPPDKTE